VEVIDTVYHRLWSLTLTVMVLFGVFIWWQPMHAWTGTCGLEPGPLYPGPQANAGEVAELQQRLQSLGYFTGSIDGTFGPTLELAVRRFQSDQGLTANGAVGDATWLALASGSIPVSKSSLPKPEGSMHLVIDTRSLRLTLFVDGKPYKSYPIAVGRQKKWDWSPVGEWRIVNKGVNWGSGFGTRWMGLNVPWGVYGIHGTNKPYSIGTRASGGCIRMYNHHVEELYSWIPLGTTVIISGDTPPIAFGRTLTVGSSGKDVVAVQSRLQEFGFAVGGADGRWGPASEAAARSLQELYGLPSDGKVYTDMYYILGLK
jgi:peptidoglycan hydrolase-like protein with peptidoglycan-binding domain